MLPLLARSSARRHVQCRALKVTDRGWGNLHAAGSAVRSEFAGKGADRVDYGAAAHAAAGVVDLGAALGGVALRATRPGRQAVPSL